MKGLGCGAFALWVGGTGLSWGVYSFTVMMVFAQNPAWAKILVGVVAGLIFGALAGSCQLPVLKGRARVAGWVAASALGWAAAGAVTGASSLLLSGVRLGLDYQLGVAVGGLLVGLGQWAALRSAWRRGALWVLATVIAWGLAGFISWSLYESLSLAGALRWEWGGPLAAWPADFTTEVLSGFVGAVVGGLVVGAGTTSVIKRALSS